MITPTDLLHPSSAPHLIFKAFLIYFLQCPSPSTYLVFVHCTLDVIIYHSFLTTFG